LGLSGRVPARVGAATKTGLLDMIDRAVAEGWTVRAACGYLELGEVRAHRWRARRHGDGGLDDKAPGGNARHGLLDDEISEIVALYHEWGDIDRSHRKLAHRGSYLGRVWVSPASVRRVLAAQGLDLNPPARPPASARRPFPDWVEYRPNQIWIYDTTHFTRSKMAVTIIEDLVSRKWIDHIVSAEETSNQVEIVFTDALEAEGLLSLVEARADQPVDPDVDDDRLPILLAVSDNGSQMTSVSTRKFMALCAIATHFGRPGTPTDQAWIESFNGHLKMENPHLEAITDPAVLRAELDVIRTRYNTVRLHQAIGYVTPDDEHTGRGPAIRKAREAGLETARLRRLAYHRNQPQQQPDPRPQNDV
jgi:transposase InsO family protein